MEALFARKIQLIDQIKRIAANFGKDGAHRKTAEYLGKRLTALDQLWGEFNQNNEELSKFVDKEKHEYFSTNVYLRMKEYYQSQRRIFLDYPPFAAGPSSSGNDDQEKENGTKYVFDVPACENPGTSQSIQELFSQQKTSFRALSRAIQRIDIESIEEKWEIKDQLKDLQRRWRTIDELHLRIDNVLQGSDKTYDQELSRYEDMYNNIKRDLNRKLSSTVQLQYSTPKVEIPIFTGKYSQWPTFFDPFSETIHNNNGLSKAQKMQYLKGKLKGEAERLIQHINISAENYQTAWEILTHRYNNPQVLFTNQIETFLNQPSVQKQSSYELKRLHDTTMECIHAIHNLGVDTTTWDPLLVHLICKKLDSETYSDYKEARKSPRDLASLDELMQFLESKFTALEPISKKERDESRPKSPKLSHQTGQKYTNRPNYQSRFRNTNYQSWQLSHQNVYSVPESMICSSVKGSLR